MITGMSLFSIWNVNKERLDNKLNGPIFYAGEIWWCALGKNIGQEQDGKNQLFERPVMILKKFNDDICIILPTTSTEKVGRYYHTINQIQSAIILSQIRLISSKRLLRLITRISRSEFEIIRQKVKGIL